MEGGEIKNKREKQTEMSGIDKKGEIERVEKMVVSNRNRDKKGKREFEKLNEREREKPLDRERLCNKTKKEWEKLESVSA